MSSAASLTAAPFIVYIRLHKMGNALTLKAPAKINLHLEILGLRRDGYHEILSVFQAVTLFDRVRVRSLKQKQALRLVCSPPIPAERNIATRAVQLFRERSGISAGIDLELAKRIPSGAGLGGGSSDAACVLLGLNRLFGFVFSPGELLEMGARLGSDVPFFLGGPAALVWGRGEKMEVLSPVRDFELLLVYPGFPILSADAYRWYDEEISQEGVRPGFSLTELKNEYLGRPVSGWRFWNSFQETVLRRFPVLAGITADLKRQGAHLAAVSGSGSAVFGVFMDRRSARRARDDLRRAYPFVEMLKPLQYRASEDYNMVTRTTIRRSGGAP